MADVKRRRREYWAGLVAVVAAMLVAAFRWWPVPNSAVEGSLVETLIDDPILVGLLRLAFVVLALYAIASIPALIVGGRWAKGVGTTGILADDAREPLLVAEARREAAVFQLAYERVARERDELLSLMDVQTRPD